MLARLLKNHWPIILMAAMALCCINDYRWFGSSDGEKLSYSILFNVFLMPMSAFIVSLWYGFRHQNREKMFVVPMCGVTELFVAAIQAGNIRVWDYWGVSLFALVPAALGMLIGSMAAHLKRH